MKLRKTTVLAMTGISYIFISRAVATFFPGLLSGRVYAGVNALAIFIASLALFLFYLYFKTGYLRVDQEKLKKASNLMIIGSAAVSLLHLRAFFSVVGKIFLRSPALDLFIPWAVVLISLYFFIIFHREGEFSPGSKLNRAVLLAASGSALSILLRTVVMINYSLEEGSRWLWNYTARYPFIFLPIQTFIFISFFYFLLVFYRVAGNSEAAC